MKANYHTHTKRCKHAQGEDESYVCAAIEAGFDVIGFSDHTPWPYESGFSSHIRMDVRELEDYVRSVRALGEKYKDQIRVLAALECEHFPRYMDWLFDKKREMGIDYLILGNHFDETDETGAYFGRIASREMLRRYVTSSIKALETGEFAYFAHPDLYMRGYPAFDADCREAAREICRAARALGIPLEYNLEGLRQSQREGRALYPYPAFWEIAAQEDVNVIIGVDAHSPQVLTDTHTFEKSRALLESMGLRVLSALPLGRTQEYGQ